LSVPVKNAHRRGRLVLVWLEMQVYLCHMAIECVVSRRDDNAIVKTTIIKTACGDGKRDTRASLVKELEESCSSKTALWMVIYKP
jgi:hypothetical protein